MNDTATRQASSRYDRLAGLYDLREAIVERLAYRGWRKRLWSQVQGNRVLEVGAGTGKNLPYYPEGVRVTAIDVSDRMLGRARKRAAELGIEVDFHVMDAQRLQFADGTFDEAVATFVFCSVPDPVLGLREMARVVRPGGRILLLEHVRLDRPVLGRLMDWLDPFVLRLMGPHINRRTVENVTRAGLQIERVEDLTRAGMFKLITIRKAP